MKKKSYWSVSYVLCIINVHVPTYFVQRWSQKLLDMTLEFSGYVKYRLKLSPIKFNASGAITWSSTRHEIWVQILFFFPPPLFVGRISPRWLHKIAWNFRENWFWFLIISPSLFCHLKKSFLVFRYLSCDKKTLFSRDLKND